MSSSVARFRCLMYGANLSKNLSLCSWRYFEQRTLFTICTTYPRIRWLISDTLDIHNQRHAETSSDNRYFNSDRRFTTLITAILADYRRHTPDTIIKTIGDSPTIASATVYRSLHTTHHAHSHSGLIWTVQRLSTNIQHLLVTHALSCTQHSRTSVGLQNMCWLSCHLPVMSMVRVCTHLSPDRIRQL